MSYYEYELYFTDIDVMGMPSLAINSVCLSQCRACVLLQFSIVLVAYWDLGTQLSLELYLWDLYCKYELYVMEVDVMGMLSLTIDSACLFERRVYPLSRFSIASIVY